jgi:hypothetical protein
MYPTYADFIKAKGAENEKGIGASSQFFLQLVLP